MERQPFSREKQDTGDEDLPQESRGPQQVLVDWLIFRDSPDRQQARQEAPESKEETPGRVEKLRDFFRKLFGYYAETEPITTEAIKISAAEAPESPAEWQDSLSNASGERPGEKQAPGEADAGLTKEREGSNEPQSIKQILSSRHLEKSVKGRLQTDQEAETLAHASSQELPSDSVLQEVERLASKNAPLEKAMERRHEVKDQKHRSNLNRAIGKATVMLKAATGRFRKTVSGNRHLADSTQDHATIVIPQPLSTRQEYRAAVLRGAAAAVALLLVVTAIVLLTD